MGLSLCLITSTPAFSSKWNIFSGNILNAHKVFYKLYFFPIQMMFLIFKLRVQLVLSQLPLKRSHGYFGL